MRLGMMLNDGDEMRTGGPLTYDTAYQKPGGIQLPYIKPISYPVSYPKYPEDVDVFIIRRDPVTGEIYEGGPRTEDEIPWTQPMHGPHILPPEPKPPIAVDPGPIAYTGGSADFDETTGRYRNPNDPRNAAIDAANKPPTQSLMKPLLIAGAVVAALTLLKD